MTKVILPPAEKMAAIVKWAAQREGWDMLHEFVTLRWDPEGGGKLLPITIYAIDPAIDPDEYPPMIQKMAADSLENHADEWPCAYLLLIEGYATMEPDENASEEDKALFKADRIARTFHLRADRREIKMAAATDLSGCTWTATQYRDTGELQEKNYPADDDDEQIGGQMAQALVDAAGMTGELLQLIGIWDGRDERGGE